MKAVLPLTGLMLVLVMLAGCQDNSREVQQLKTNLIAEQKRLDQANDKWANERDALQAEINDLRKQIGNNNMKRPGALPVSARIDDLERKVNDSAAGPADAKLTAKVDAVNKTVEDMKGQLDDIKAKGTGDGGNVDTDKLADLVAKKLADKQITTPPTKNLNEALDRLEISQGEKDEVRQDIIDAKKQILETLEVPDADGHIYAEELVDTMIKVANGDLKQSDAMALFVTLSQKKIPGDMEGRTYMEAINAIKAQNHEDIGRILSKQDQQKLSAAHKDWTDFDIGDGDPWSELYMERLQKYQNNKKG